MFTGYTKNKKQGDKLSTVTEKKDIEKDIDNVQSEQPQSDREGQTSADLLREDRWCCQCNERAIETQSHF